MSDAVSIRRHLMHAPACCALRMPVLKRNQPSDFSAMGARPRRRGIYRALLLRGGMIHILSIKRPAHRDAGFIEI